MPRVYGTVNVLEFDAKGYSEAVRKQIALQFRQAARAFLRAAIPLIPVQSGMARGSFLNIGKFLKVAVPINPKRTGELYYGGRRGASPIPKTPESGAALTTPADQIIQEIAPGQFVFEIQSNVFHLTLEDLIGYRSPTAPWGAFIAGRAAFMLEMKNLKSRLPSITSYITKTSITFGRGAPIRSTPIRLRRQETVGE